MGNARFLSEKGHREMTSLQTGELVCGFTPGMGFGFGWAVVKQPQEVHAMMSKGTYGHGGAWGTQAWIDPAKGVAYVLMVQRSNFPNSDASEVRREFQQAAAKALAVGFHASEVNLLRPDTRGIAQHDITVPKERAHEGNRDWDALARHAWIG